MAATILIKATDSSNSNPEKDKFCYKRGYPVIVKPTWWQWGSKETLPNFVRVTVSDATAEELETYVDMWRREIEFSIVSHDAPLDKYRIDVSVKSEWVDVSGTAGLTQAAVQQYLELWNYDSIVSTSTNNVRFDTFVWNNLQSVGFWEYAPMTDFGFTKDSYNQTTGEYVVELDWSATGLSVNAIGTRIESKGGTVIDYDAGTMTGHFSIMRSSVWQDFQDDVYDKMNDAIARRIYYISDAGVTLAEDAGGSMTVTKSQLATYLNNKLDE